MEKDKNSFFHERITGNIGDMVLELPDGRKISGDDLKAYLDERIVQLEMLHNQKNHTNIDINSKDFLIGFAVGDAFGVPIEGQNRETMQKNQITTMTGFGKYNMPIGSWSDDTSMTVATMESIIEKQGVDYENIMQYFCKWYLKNEFTPTNKLFDIGHTTRRAIKSYLTDEYDAVLCGEIGINSNGNGSLMRMLPIYIYLLNKNFSREEEIKTICDISSLTHMHGICKLSCVVLYDFFKNLLKSKDLVQAIDAIQNYNYLEDFQSEYVDALNPVLKTNIFELDETTVKSSGYVVNTLQAVIWGLIKTNSYKDLIIKLVNLGGDTDTIAAIAGGIGGIIYGYDNIPKEWKDSLLKRDYLENLAEQFTDYITSMKEANVEISK